MIHEPFRITTTSQEILAILSSRPTEEFYVNELIRLTGRYPNSVEQSLRVLLRKQLVRTRQIGNKSFYRIHPRYGHAITGQAIPSTAVTWVKLLNRETSYAFNIALCTSNIKNLAQRYGITIQNFWTNSLTYGVYYLQQDLEALGETIADTIGAKPTFARTDPSDCRKQCDNLVRISKKCGSIHLGRQTVGGLVKLIREFDRHYTNVFPFLVVPHAIERYFETQIRNAVPNTHVADVLLTPVLGDDEERTSALKLVVHAKKHGFDEAFHTLLMAHWKAFCWLPLWSLLAKPLTQEYFFDEIRTLLRTIDDPEQEFARIQVDQKNRQNKLERTLRRLKASQILNNQVHILQEYMYLRTYRKNAMCQAHYYHLPLIHEVAKRIGLAHSEICYVSYPEMERGLTDQGYARRLKLLVRRRQHGWAVQLWRGRVRTITGTRKIVEAMEQYTIVPPRQPSQNVLKGMVACRGRVMGRVKVIHKVSELGKLQKGEILVTKMTTPDFVVAMRTCAGIVTDEGGVTCHAAIISREYGIPCITGTHKATKVLADNDFVELDGISGVIRIVEKVAVDTSTKSMSGKTLYPGNVSGKAVIVRDAEDFPKITKGQILISSQITPAFLSSLYRVKGLIVDEDSYTSHAALYAQALHIPAIMGTIHAQEILTDGELIVLDAGKGVVRRRKNA